MRPTRETLGFALALAVCLVLFLHDTLVGGKILSPADVLLVEASFRPAGTTDYEPLNRLLMDPVLQFQPWLEFNRAMVRQGRLPLWNPYAGCGTPHLANGQSAVFDPFHLIAYLGTVPQALAWMAAGRLWAAGLGMFLLARAWGCGFWGRWFAGLVYPFCGFLILWLLYPVTPVAIWLPWILLASDRVLKRPGPRNAGLLALVVALVIAGGHIQTSAHVLLAAGLLAIWRMTRRLPGTGPAPVPPVRHSAPGDPLSPGLHTAEETVVVPNSGRFESRSGLLAWTAGIALGVLLAAVQVLPLAGYLARSSVWSDRQRETAAWYTLARPRLADALCTALPYLYGSQRRGHPNLARGLGVHNLNESAGGYAGLATLIWLAPLALGRRSSRPEVGLLAAMGIIGAMAAFRVFPVDNLFRALPVLSVTDNRRFTLWVAFSLCLLGGFGMDALACGSRLPRRWVLVWLACAAILAAAAVAVPRLEPVLRRQARRHYRETARLVPQADASLLAARGERQVRAALDFLPRYYGMAAFELVLLVILAQRVVRPGSRRAGLVPAVLTGVTLLELGGFGMGLNPGVPLSVHDIEPPTLPQLRRALKPGARLLGIGEELPPNVLMRFGLADPRNYDSVELTDSLGFFAPLYDPGTGALSSRAQITWDGVLRARDRLEAACVQAVIGSSRPPDSFPRMERMGNVWIAWLDPRPRVSFSVPGSDFSARQQPGEIVVRTHGPTAGPLVIRETWDPGWNARIDGGTVFIDKHEDSFMSIYVPAGDHQVELRYRPAAVVLGLWGSALGTLAMILALTERLCFRIPGITRTGLGRIHALTLESSQ